jgi:hypothetical protein
MRRPVGLGMLLALVVVSTSAACHAPSSISAAKPEVPKAPAPAGGGSVSAKSISQPARVSLVPTSIAESDPEISNPFRGSYEWLDSAPQPAGWPVVDSYARIGWRELEPQQGVYDFTYLDKELAQAKARGGKLGLRIMPACTGCSPTSIEVPDYLKALMPQGFWFPLNGTNNYAPDWNSAAYLDRLNRLLQALGQRYDNDPRLGWVEISAYGDWGEWHVTGWPYPSPTGATPITDANARKIVDMNVAAFPHKRLLMLHDDQAALAYALSLSPAIGIRNDCLGDQWFTNAMTALLPIIKDRWKTAPIITEYCYQHPQSAGFRLAAGQIQTFHVAMIGNGNMDPLSSFSAADQSLFRSNNEAAGYRFILNNMTLPSHVTPGSSFTLDASWSNLGATPSYTQWSVSLRLSDPATGAVVWQEPSRVDLSTLLPTRDGTIDHPAVVTDTAVLPATVRPGRYVLSVVAADPSGYYQPLNLAVRGRRPDGSYPVGTVTVG